MRTQMQVAGEGVADGRDRRGRLERTDVTDESAYIVRAHAALPRRRYPLGAPRPELDFPGAFDSERYIFGITMFSFRPS